MSNEHAGPRDVTAVQNFIADAKKAIGDDLVGVIDNSGTSGHVGFATTEDDKGPDVRGKYIDAIKGAAKQNGITIALLPFATHGKLVYEAAIHSTEEK